MSERERFQRHETEMLKFRRELLDLVRTPGTAERKEYDSYPSLDFDSYANVKCWQAATQAERERALVAIQDIRKAISDHFGKLPQDLADFVQAKAAAIRRGEGDVDAQTSTIIRGDYPSRL